MIFDEDVAAWLGLDTATANDLAEVVALDIEHGCEAALAKHGITQRQLTFFTSVHLLNRLCGHEDAEERKTLVGLATVLLAQAGTYPGPEYQGQEPSDRMVN